MEMIFIGKSLILLVDLLVAGEKQQSTLT